MTNATILANNTNITSYDDMIHLANDITGDMFPLAILITFYFITLLALSRHDVKNAFQTANLTTFIFSILFLAMNAINPTIPAILGVLTFISYAINH